MQDFIRDLIKTGYLRSDLIIGAFKRIDRIDFVPESSKHEAYINSALPIGYGQTISQPLTVAFMLELLDSHPGQKVLDVGSGSGWTTTLLAEIVGEKGKVIAVERIKELLEFGKNNIEKYNFIKKGIAEFHLADGSVGFPAEVPFERILVSASSPVMQEELKNQLAIGGKMVIPVKSSIIYIERKGEDKFYQEEYPGFAFVPLITKDKQ